MVFTTDENTPNFLYYYSPLYSGAGAPIIVTEECSGVFQVALLIQTSRLLQIGIVVFLFILAAVKQ